jgi:D-proline reductase (dithiol) PrdB
LFSDFPLGNAAGKPHDAVSQEQTLALALDLLVCAPSARTTVQSPQRWSEDFGWKLDYSNPDRTPPEELVRLRAEADQARAEIARLKGKTLG